MLKPARTTPPGSAVLTTQQLTLTALNSSRTAYASFALHARAFFLDYDFKSNNAGSGGDRFTCQLYNRVCSLQVIEVYSLMIYRLCKPSSKVARLMLEDERRPSSSATSRFRTDQMRQNAVSS